MRWRTCEQRRPRLKPWGSAAGTIWLGCGSKRCRRLSVLPVALAVPMRPGNTRCSPGLLPTLWYHQAFCQYLAVFHARHCVLHGIGCFDALQVELALAAVAELPAPTAAPTPWSFWALSLALLCNVVLVGASLRRYAPCCHVEVC